MGAIGRRSPCRRSLDASETLVRIIILRRSISLEHAPTVACQSSHLRTPLQRDRGFRPVLRLRSVFSRLRSTRKHRRCQMLSLGPAPLWIPRLLLPTHPPSSGHRRFRELHRAIENTC